VTGSSPYNRRQFAELYPTDENLSGALERFPSWDQIVRRGLSRRARGETPPLPDSEFRCVRNAVVEPRQPVQRSIAISR
jgi:hypothetical protein